MSKNIGKLASIATEFNQNFNQKISADMKLMKKVMDALTPAKQAELQKTTASLYGALQKAGVNMQDLVGGKIQITDLYDKSPEVARHSIMIIDQAVEMMLAELDEDFFVNSVPASGKNTQIATAFEQLGAKTIARLFKKTL